jgi:hypothetical protein
MLTKCSISTNEQSRILLLSVKGIQSQVANACLYEFEDIICNIEGVDVFIPQNDFPWRRKIYRLARYITQSDFVASTITPFPITISLEREYDLLFAVLDNPWQMYMVNTIKGWRDRTKLAACYIGEVWEKDFDNWRLLQEPFKSFDHIFVGVSHCVDKLSQLIGRPCSYLPPAVDTTLFCPFPIAPQRNIDVCYIGRRLSEIHHRLLELTLTQDFFYYYDTALRQDFKVENYLEHRLLLANLLKRSRHTIIHHAKFNRPQETGGKQEIGYRFFEGAAAGTVMLGMPPNNKNFQKYFGWSNAVVKVDWDTCDIKEVLSELNAQPELLEQISRNNVINSLQKHDWVYRWRQILTTLNLKPTTGMLAREKYLQQLVQAIQVQVPVC